jgi:histidinol-phosphate aminotransferase
MLDLAAPGVQKLNPYLPGKPIEELQREYGLTQVIKLASNENPLGPSPLAIEAAQKQLLAQSRYPDGNGFILKQALAAHLSVKQNQITLGNGSNDVLELLARAFVTNEHEVIFSQHAFAVYPIVTQAINAKAVVTQAKDWGHDLDAMSKAVNRKTRLIFIANPNNPTGTWLTKEPLEAFIAALPPHVIVVVDEAYFEYARDERMHITDYPDCLQWIDSYPNLVVTRTFSKAYGLAGFRIGYCVSDPGIADLLNRVRQPFNVNGLALAAATVALTDKNHLDKTVDTNCSGLLQLIEGFKSLGLDYITSAGNFICVDVGKSAGSVYEGLLQKGVIVRPVENYAMPNHLRVSVGLKSENLAFLQALEVLL